MVKKVQAPKTYDPGKGRPKEHLAYLNEREMAYLRSINGNNMERGPRGLPSFPPADAAGSSSRAPSGPSRNTGPGGPSGPNSGPSGGGIGQGGQGGGSRGPGGPSGPNSGPSASQQGGQRGPTSSTQTASTTSSGAYKGPASPMSGQGASFSSPVFALGVNRDYIERQKAAMADASGVLRSNKAAKGDLLSGGIKTLNVGPMGTPVNVRGPIKSAAPVQPAPTGIAGSISAFKYSSPLTPGRTPADLAALGAYQQRMEEEARATALQGVYTPTGNPKIAGAFPTKPAIQGSLPSYDIPPPVDVTRVYGYGPQLPGAEKVLSIENVPPETSYAKLYETATEALARTSARKNFQTPTTGDFSQAAQYNPEDEFSEQTSIPSWAQGTSRSRTPGKTRGIGAQENTVVSGVPEGTYGPETPVNDYVDTAEQMPAEEPPYRITGGRFYDAAKKKLSDYLPSFPSLTGGPGSDYSRFTSDNDRGPIRRNPFQVAQSTSGFGFGGGRGGGGGSSRPQQYYNWDAGVGVPSPGDSDYTLYLKYLQEKAAAQAAVS